MQHLGWCDIAVQQLLVPIKGCHATHGLLGMHTCVWAAGSLTLSVCIGGKHIEVHGVVSLPSHLPHKVL